MRCKYTTWIETGGEKVKKWKGGRGKGKKGKVESGKWERGKRKKGKGKSGKGEGGMYPTVFKIQDKTLFTPYIPYTSHPL